MMEPSPHRVVVAPDKFKGSLSARAVARAIARGVIQEKADVEVIQFPIADGGEGTIDLLVAAGFESLRADASGPLGDPVRAVVAIRADTAVIESASAIGLGLLGGAGPTAETAARSSTFGVGQLIAFALDKGVSRIIVGLGGSASTDGGAGAVMALGGRVLDKKGRPLCRGGEHLVDAFELDLSAIDSRLAGTELIVGCDVDNPLTGPNGAAYGYGPQKGGSPLVLGLLEEAMQTWADLVARTTGQDVRALAGAGAAGGLGFGLAAVLGGRVTSGVDLLLDLVGFDGVAAGASLVIVGEGSLDEQSLRGKGPVGVARRARALGGRAVAVVGRSLVPEHEARTHSLDAVYALTSLEPDEDRCIAEAESLLVRTGRRVAADQLSY